MKGVKGENNNKKNITLRVDKKLHNDYKKHCELKGYSMSRKFEIFMEKEMENEKNIQQTTINENTK
mgnify:CR=1 FL=1